MSKVCVLGGGPAGMMAAYAAAIKGHHVQLFEKNEKLGKKLYITGKGRCNITNAADIQDCLDNVVSNKNFLYSAFYTFTNSQLIEMLNSFGLKTKVERGGRVFPISDKSSDVIKTIEKALKSAGVDILLNTKVHSVIVDDNVVKGIITGEEKQWFDCVIVSTGGISYSSTGSTGDGYIFAKKAGHKIIDAQPSLVGLETQDDVSILAGLTLKNVSLSLMMDGKLIYKNLGEMLFTHAGISGPLVLSASAHMQSGNPYIVSIDLKPALDDKTLDARILRDIQEKSNKDFSNVLRGLIPSKLIPMMIRRVGVNSEKKAHSITKQERNALVRALKDLALPIKCKRSIEEAVITRGGVDVKGIDASTMQSKHCSGLYFAGEVIDVDALTGGYNLQIAFSTGYLAGISC